MHTFLRSITDLVTTKKGAWITLAIWIVVAVILSITAPSSKDYSVNNVTTLYPETSPSEIAQQKIDQHFKEDEGIPAILVFETKESHLNLDELLGVTEVIQRFHT